MNQLKSRVIETGWDFFLLFVINIMIESESWRRWDDSSRLYQSTVLHWTAAWVVSLKCVLNVWGQAKKRRQKLALRNSCRMFLLFWPRLLAPPGEAPPYLMAGGVQSMQWSHTWSSLIKTAVWAHKYCFHHQEHSQKCEGDDQHCISSSAYIFNLVADACLWGCLKTIRKCLNHRWPLWELWWLLHRSDIQSAPEANMKTGFFYWLARLSSLHVLSPHWQLREKSIEGVVAVNLPLWYFNQAS